MKTLFALLPLCLALRLSAQVQTPVPVANDAAPDEDFGLVAHYRFDQELAPGATVADRADKGYDLTVTGEGIAACPGVQGRGARLSGATLNAKENPLAGAEAFTASLWFRTADPTANIKLIAAARWAGGNDASGWLISTHASEFWAHDQAGSLSGAEPWDRKVKFIPNEWNHLVVTCDGRRVREYINGALSVDIAATGRRLGAGVPMTIGAWNGRFPLAGDVDEIRLYRRALGEADIRALAAREGRGGDGEPVAVRTSDEPAGRRLAMIRLNQADAAARPEPAQPRGLTGRWKGKAVNSARMSDCELNLVEDADGGLTGTWGSPGVNMVRIDRGERLGSDLLRWESTSPGIMRWFVTGRINGDAIVLETIGVVDGRDLNKPAPTSSAVLIRE